MTSAGPASRLGLLVAIFGSARLAHVLATVGIGLGAGSFFLQRTLGWAGFLAALIGALVLMWLAESGRRWRRGG